VGLAEVDRLTGLASSWDFGFPGAAISALAISDSTLIFSGGFTAVDGQPARYCAEVELTTRRTTQFRPRPELPVEAIGVAGGVVFVGGPFFSIGPEWQPRADIAALDLSTGRLSSWDPHANSTIILSIVPTHGRIYVGGYFTGIGGQARACLAALDTTTGLATDWDPSPNSAVGSLEVVGDTLYVGGYFTSAGGQSRSRLASFDLNTGAVTSWNPSAESDVYDVRVSGGTAYVSGFFWHIGGLPRKGLAAVDAISGAILDWDPQSDNICYATSILGDTVLVAGYFSTIGGQSRSNLAAIDRTTGRALDWSPTVNDGVTSMGIMKDTLLIGGTFTLVNGEHRMGFAALNLRDGQTLGWDPDLSSDEWFSGTMSAGADRFLVDGATLYFGGGFWRVGLFPATGVAAVSFGPPVEDPPPTGLAFSRPSPNPCRGETTLRFYLPASAAVSLEAYDLQGRRVASVLDRTLMAAGPHQVALRMLESKSGVYFCHLRAAGKSATQKLLVVR
jgi:hypothetical protein